MSKKTEYLWSGTATKRHKGEMRVGRNDAVITDEEWKIFEQKIKMFKEHVKSFQKEVEKNLRYKTN